MPQSLKSALDLQFASLIIFIEAKSLILHTTNFCNSFDDFHQSARDLNFFGTEIELCRLNTDSMLVYFVKKTAHVNSKIKNKIGFDPSSLACYR